MSKRMRFNKIKNLQDNLKKYNAFSIDGYFPLFNTIDDAIAVSPESSYHTHELNGLEYYMPNGLKMGKTQFHGDYKEQDTQTVDDGLEQEEQLPPTPPPTPESSPQPPQPTQPQPTPQSNERVVRTGGTGY